MEDIRIRFSTDTSDLKKSEAALAGLTKEEKRMVEEFRKINNEASRSAKRIDNEFSKVNSTIKSIGTTLVAAGIAERVLSAGMAALTSAANYERLKVSFTTFLGSAEKADKVLQDLTRFSDKTPYEPEQVNQAGRALLAFNFSANELIPTLTKIGDISAGTGKDINELTTIYGKARIAGTLYAEDINQLTEAGIPIITEFAKQMGVTESQVKKLASEGKIGFKQLETAFTNMTSEGGKFAGLMDALSKDTLGKYSNASAQIEAIGKSLGDNLLPVANAILDTFSAIAEKIIDIQTDDFTKAQQAASSAAEELVKSLGNIEQSQADEKINQLIEANRTLKEEIEGLDSDRVNLVNKLGLGELSALERQFGIDVDKFVGDLTGSADQVVVLEERMAKLRQEFNTNSNAIELLKGKFTEANPAITQTKGLIETLQDKVKDLKKAQEGTWDTAAIRSYQLEIEATQLKIQNLIEGLKSQDFFSGIREASSGLVVEIDEVARYVFDETANVAQARLAVLARDLSKDLKVPAPDYLSAEQREQAHQERMAEIRRQAFDLSVNLINGFIDISENGRQKDIQSLETAKDHELQLVGDNEQAKNFINEKFDRQNKILKEKQAKSDRDQALFNIAIDTSVAIGKAIAASPLTFGLPFSAFAAAQGGIQAALVASKSIPKYRYGIESVPGVDYGTDSVLAMLRPKERVVPTEINQQLGGIKNELLPAAVRSFLEPIPMPQRVEYREFPKNTSDQVKLQAEVAAMRGDIGRLNGSIKKLKVPNVNVDKKGVNAFLVEGDKTTELLNNQFSL